MSQVVIAPDHIVVPINEKYLTVNLNLTEYKIERGVEEEVSDAICDLLHWMERQTGDMGIIYKNEEPKVDRSKADYHELAE